MYLIKYLTWKQPSHLSTKIQISVGKNPSSFYGDVHSTWTNLKTFPQIAHAQWKPWLPTSKCNDLEIFASKSNASPIEWPSF